MEYHVIKYNGPNELIEGTIVNNDTPECWYIVDVATGPEDVGTITYVWDTPGDCQPCINNHTTTTTTTAAPGPGNVGIAASTDFDIVGNFTIEMFVNMSNLDGFPRPYSFGTYPAPNAMSIEGGQLYFWANNAALINGTFNPTIGQWYHLCIIGQGSTVYMLINGIQISTSPYSGSISSQALPLTIGFGNEPNSGFNGLMSNFRWTDTDVYDIHGFTVPTTPLTPLPESKLLIFQGDNLTLELTDNSGNGHDATNSGATYSTFNPFSGYAGSLQMGTV
jgi:hypothetical protein